LRGLVCLLCSFCAVLLAPQQQQQQQHADVPRRQQFTCRAAATAEGELKAPRKTYAALSHWLLFSMMQCACKLQEVAKDRADEPGCPPAAAEFGGMQTGLFPCHQFSSEPMVHAAACGWMQYMQVAADGNIQC
jgi:hypothetical protein